MFIFNHYLFCLYLCFASAVFIIIVAHATIEKLLCFLHCVYCVFRITPLKSSEQLMPPEEIAFSRIFICDNNLIIHVIPIDISCKSFKGLPIECMHVHVKRKTHLIISYIVSK